MTLLATERLLLRPLDAGDLAALEAIFSDREHMWDLMGIPGRPDDAGALARYYLDRSVRAFRGCGAGMWGMHPRVAPAAPIVGYTGLVVDIGDEVDIAGEVEAGWAVAPDRTGKGYAGEATAAVFDHLFGVLGVRRVSAVTSPGNRPSRRLMERLGMSRGDDVTAYQGLQAVYAIDREAWRSRRLPAAGGERAAAFPSEARTSSLTPPRRGGRSCGR